MSRKQHWNGVIAEPGWLVAHEQTTTTHYLDRGRVTTTTVRLGRVETVEDGGWVTEARSIIDPPTVRTVASELRYVVRPEQLDEAAVEAALRARPEGDRFESFEAVRAFLTPFKR